jgi:hypothetical protein
MEMGIDLSGDRRCILKIRAHCLKILTPQLSLYIQIAGKLLNQPFQLQTD